MQKQCTKNKIWTRLNAFTRSCLFNTTAVAAQCHSQQVWNGISAYVAIANQHKLTYSESIARRRHLYLHHLLGRPLIAEIPNVSIVSFVGVYGSKFTKFSTLVEHHGDCLLWKFEAGLQQKILRESPKTWNFCTCACKSVHCVYLGGQRSRSNVHLVGHCLMVPEPF